MCLLCKEPWSSRRRVLPSLLFDNMDGENADLGVTTAEVVAWLAGRSDGELVFERNSFGQLPAEFVELVGHWAEALFQVDVSGGIPAAVRGLIESVQDKLGAVTQKQTDKCQGRDPAGGGCSTTTRGARNVQLGHCAAHMNHAWPSLNRVGGERDLRPVTVECCHCVQTQPADEQLVTKRCLGCGVGLHPGCLRSWALSVDPGFDESALGIEFEGDLLEWACAVCLSKCWPALSLEIHLLVGRDEGTKVLLMPSPPGDGLPGSDTALELEAYDQARQQVESLPVGVMVLAKALAPPSRTASRFSMSRSKLASSMTGRRSAPSLKGKEEDSSDDEDQGGVEATARATLRLLQRSGLLDGVRSRVDACVLSRVGTSLLDLIHGTAFGAKTGEEGAMNSPVAHQTEPYDSQGDARGGPHRRVVRSCIHSGSATTVQAGYGPERKQEQRSIEITADGQFRAGGSTSTAVPLQQSYTRFVAARSGQWARADWTCTARGIQITCTTSTWPV